MCCRVLCATPFLAYRLSSILVYLSFSDSNLLIGKLRPPAPQMPHNAWPVSLYLEDTQRVKGLALKHILFPIFLVVGDRPEPGALKRHSK